MPVSRAASFGGALGICLGSADAIVLSDGAATPLEIVAIGVLATGLGHALTLGILTAALGVLRAPLRVLSAAVAAISAALVVLHAASLLLKMYSGTFLTLGAARFCMNSWPHIVEAARSDFVEEITTLVAVGLLTGVGAGWWVSRRGHWALTSRRVVVGTAALLPAMAVVVPVYEAPRHPVWRTTAELALVASVSRAYGMNESAHSGAEPRIARGPTRTTQALWREFVEGSSAPRPNVLLLVLESVRLDALGYEGYERRATPHLDRLAAGSVRFRRTWATATHSSYSQMATLSSLFPYRGKTLDMYYRLDYPRLLWHDVLHLAGYSTATISSQDETWQGMRRFQDTGTPTTFLHAEDYDGERLLVGSERIMPDHVTAEKAMEWIARQEGQPWGLYVNLQSTHFSYRIPDSEKPRFAPTEPTQGEVTYFNYGAADRDIVRNRYDSALAYVDAQVGRIFRFLEDRGELDDTLWIVTADHGESFLDHGLVTHGRSLFDTEARVPMLFHYPARLAPMDVTTPVSQLDLLPTVLDVIGLPDAPAHQGSSLGPLIEEPDQRGVQPRAIFMNIQGLRSMRGVVCWPYKLVVDDESESVLLFDLAADPGETHDIQEDRPEAADALGKLLRAFIAAQRAYHKPKNEARERYFAPRIPGCPDLGAGP